MKDRNDTETADQRRVTRRSLDATVTLRLETDALEGQGENISRAGILLYCDQPIRVVVEIAESSGPRTFRGRMIRLQRIDDASTGIAIEFDPD